jgi:hypothetical protein
MNKLVFTIVKELLQLNNKIIHNSTEIQFKNEQRICMDISPKKIYIHMANKHMKRCSTSLVISKIQIRATKKNYFTLPNNEKENHR